MTTDFDVTLAKSRHYFNERFAASGRPRIYTLVERSNMYVRWTRLYAGIHVGYGIMSAKRGLRGDWHVKSIIDEEKALMFKLRFG